MAIRFFDQLQYPLALKEELQSASRETEVSL